MRYGSFCTISNAKKNGSLLQLPNRCVYVKNKDCLCYGQTEKNILENLNPQIEKSKSGSFEQKQEITSDL